MVSENSTHQRKHYNALGDSSVQFPTEGSSICCKAFVSVISLSLLVASLTVVSLLLKSDDFVLRLNLEQQKTLVYQFEQSCVINGVKRDRHNLTSTVSVRIVNRTTSDFWFYVKIVLPTQMTTQIATTTNGELFLVRCLNGISAGQPKTTERFEIYGNPKIATEFIYFVANAVEQLFPEIQAKLYGMAFGRKNWNQKRNIDRSSIIPFSVNIHQKVKRNKGKVLLVNKFNEEDFDCSLADELDDWSNFWSVEYIEKATVLEKTGILTKSIMDLTVSLPFSNLRPNNKKTGFKSFAVKISSNVLLLKDDKTIDKWNTEDEQVWTRHCPSLSWNHSTSNDSTKFSSSASRVKEKSSPSSCGYEKYQGDKLNDQSALIYQPPEGSFTKSSGLFLFDLKELIRMPTRPSGRQWPGFVSLRRNSADGESSEEEFKNDELWSSLKESDSKSDAKDDMDDNENAKQKSQDNFDYDDPRTDSPPFVEDEENDNLRDSVGQSIKQKLQLETPSFPFPPFLPFPPLLPPSYPFDEESSNNHKTKRSVTIKSPAIATNQLDPISGSVKKDQRLSSSFSQNSLKVEKRFARKPFTLSTGQFKSSRMKRSIASDLNDIWDIISYETTDPKTFSKASVEVFHQTILGVKVMGEVRHDIRPLDDDFKEGTWEILQTVYFNVGRFRFTVLRKKHQINGRLKAKLRERRKRHYLVPAGDLMKCTYLSYLRTICVRLRLLFNLTVAYRTSRFSPMYPIELDVKVEPKAEVVSSISVHSTSWLLSGGVQGYGTLSNLTAPLNLNFHEDFESQWCTASNVTFTEHNVHSFPFEQWSCKDFNESLHNGCLKFEETIVKNSHQNIKTSSRILHNGCISGDREKNQENDLEMDEQN